VRASDRYRETGSTIPISAFAGGVNIYAYCEGDPIDYADPTGLCGASIGDVFAQLRNGDTWREGLATSGYALGNLFTGGRAFSQYSNRPGFEASRACWGIGAAAAGSAGAVAAWTVAAPIVATNPMYISWAAGTGTSAAGVVGKEALDALEAGPGDGEVPIAYGPSAQGALREFANRFGAKTLSDNPNVDALPIEDLSRQVLDKAAQTGRPVLWDLTHMDDDIAGVINGTNRPNAVTSLELQHKYQNWSRFEPVVTFFRNDAKVGVPWLK
jgi:hypothetical protein